MTREETSESYAASVNRAIDYIDRHYAESLTLEVLAAQGCFSPCHFHRVFKAIVGETHHEYVARVRLEKAALMMDSGLSITDIGMSVGFSTPAHFTQAFKARFGVSPRSYHSRKKRKDRKFSIVPRVARGHTDPRTESAPSVGTLDCPPMRVAYVRHIGGYDFRIGFAWKKLMGWAAKKGALGKDSLRISCSWDNPELTDDGRLRYDACVTVPDWVNAEGAIGVKTIPGGRHAVIRFEGSIADLSGFYDRVYGELLPASGLMTGFDPGFRIHRESVAEQIVGRFRNELRIPLDGR